jgi:hypothetical protein
MLLRKSNNSVGFSLITWYVFINSSFTSDKNDFSFCKLKKTAHPHKKGSK